jgi:hypothetical protein
MNKLPKILRLSAGLVLALLAWVCAGDRPLTFGVISDCQFAAVPAAGTRLYNRSWLKLVASVEFFNARGVRFVVLNGDELGCHFPVYPPASHNLWNDEDIVARLESHPTAAAYFCGHSHAGAYAVKNGIHYLTFQGMVETGDTNAGAVVTLTRERIEIDGFGREPDRILELNPREKSQDEKQGDQYARCPFLHGIPQGDGPLPERSQKEQQQRVVRKEPRGL